MSVTAYYNAFSFLDIEHIDKNSIINNIVIISKERDIKLNDLQDRITFFNRKYKDVTPARKITISDTIVRPGAITDYLKMLNDYTCQICKVKGFKQSNGSYYIEAHHITELHNLITGSYCSDNIVIVCPTCHKKLHFAKVIYNITGNKEINVIINGKDYKFSRNILTE